MGWRDISTWIPFGGAIDLATRHVTGESLADYNHCQPSLADCETPSAAILKCRNCCWQVFLKGLSELGLSGAADVFKGALTAAAAGAAGKAAARSALKKILTGLGLFGAIGTAVDVLALLATLYKMWIAYHEAMETYCICNNDN
ncbi:hypothetical protein AAGF08_16415 [Algoriphagus sp. SE2]|uniref:hypothetical protein n=1 Tax=Algoriphagus sp. SE2 TaxID=3141536 RepID=UPI0031CD1729